MTWNWLGWIVWICAVAFLCWTIHYIRVQQLMLIAKTKKAFSAKLFWRYVGLLVVALVWLGGMSYLTFFRHVDIKNNNQTYISTKYKPLQLHNSKDNYYYVEAERSKNGSRPVISYTYWAEGNKITTNSRFGSVADGDRVIPLEASTLPWSRAKLAKENSATGQAFAAEMTVHYKNTVLNGLGLRANRDAFTYTLLRVPSSDMVSEH
ncbi:MAG: LVIS_2131 family protein [Limosilactobacillus sp.]|uniref:LVIS_2131 family protein n=1 Tax=Limosilactobacillus sp. TaxID=2773925 RepID=UPI002707C883|nr:LVIS_2131 family protein [Limosilactobacillus sp.]